MNKPDRLFCKDIGLDRIPICQTHDLRCAVFKIKPQLAPFAVVVRLIQVDSGGYFFVPFAALGLLQRHGMDKTAFQQLQAQLVKRPPVEPLRTAGCRTLEIHRQVLKVDCADKGLTRPQVIQMAFRFSGYHCSL